MTTDPLAAATRHARQQVAHWERLARETHGARGTLGEALLALDALEVASEYGAAGLVVDRAARIRRDREIAEWAAS